MRNSHKLTLMTAKDPDSDFIRAGLAKQMLGVRDTRTVQAMVQRGQITGYMMPSGHWRYSRTSIERMIERTHRQQEEAAS
jgi:predicted site-specific integrase-resolvase